MMKALQRSTWEWDNIKIEHKEIGCEGADSIHSGL